MSDIADNRVHDINEGRRCKRCKRRLVRRDCNQPIPVVTWDKGIQTQTVMTNGMVVIACPVCDLGESA